MRAFVVLAVLIGTFLAVDALAFGGRHTQAAWHGAKYKFQELHYDLSYWRQKAGR
jgi:hypothetical protein